MAMSISDLLDRADSDNFDPDNSGNSTLAPHLESMPSLSAALTHRSASLENPQLVDNERLEFLGDALIEARVSEVLFHKFTERDEGFLTLARSSLVNTDALAWIAIDLGLDRYLQLGQGERSSGGSLKRTILAGAFEAVIAAIWIDCGREKSTEAIDSTVLFEVENFDEAVSLLDPKSQLQVYFAKAGLDAPRYRTEMSGPQHAPLFIVEVHLAGGATYHGQGGSKKEAEQNAAAAAMDALLKLNESGAPNSA